jgi:uncharacterized protein involved in type VI secretion and phage assembly
VSVETLLLERAPAGPGGLLYGVYPAVVADLSDPDSQGRVKVRLPWSPDTGGDSYEAWARLATMMAGADRGTWFIPDVGDEVLVAFEGGNPRRPYVVGALWNGQDAPPERMDGAGDNNLKTICSRAGIRITLDDSDGQVKLTLETPGGHSIALDDGGVSVTIEDSNGNSVKLEPQGITITSAGQVTVNASGIATISAAMVKVDTGMAKFSGVVQCSTLIASSVVGSSYTPGAGNVW